MPGVISLHFLNERVLHVLERGWFANEGYSVGVFRKVNILLFVAGSRPEQRAELKREREKESQRRR